MDSLSWFTNNSSSIDFVLCVVSPWSAAWSTVIMDVDDDGLISTVVMDDRGLESAGDFDENGVTSNEPDAMDDGEICWFKDSM